jgi:hypothetical protein
MTEIIEQKNPSCLMCINFINNQCAAFPNGIPQEILVGENDHSEPLPNQENNIIFEPIDEQEQ